MLAALLLNRIGNTAGKVNAYSEEKADRYLATLREEHFEREAAKTSAPLVAKAPVESPEVFKINKVMVPSVTAADGVAESDDDLALLLILAEI